VQAGISASKSKQDVKAAARKETPRATKTVHIRTYGCQMNVYDSERMTELLAPLGYAPTPVPDDADMVILNTCHIREKASEKVYSELGRLRALQSAKADSGGRMILAVAGCVAQAEGEAMQARAPFVDIVLGPQSYQDLPELITRAHRVVGERLLAIDFPSRAKFDDLPAARATDDVSAFLTVQEGCDKFCSFCVVPYTRGSEYSRPADAVIDEARNLVANGVREVTLLGQNVNAYHGEGADADAWPLARLIRALAEIDGLERIRYTTSHPRDMTDDLIAAHSDVPALMPYLHLPVQSGSNRVLAAMNRKHTTDDYMRLVDKLREARPDLALSSDFIVGYPGETDRDFADTMALVERVRFAGAYSFKYSARPGTPAAIEADRVDEDAKKDRLAALQTLLIDQQRDFNDATVGLTLPVLLEKPGRRAGQLVGRSPFLQPVHVTTGIHRIGDIVDLDIVERQANSLAAVVPGGVAVNDAGGAA
jgi:tRNA-2-methylthio-N6-dimethylallyladenosine synthase